MKEQKLLRRESIRKRGTCDAEDMYKQVCAPTTEENLREAAGEGREEGREKIKGRRET